METAEAPPVVAPASPQHTQRRDCAAALCDTLAAGRPTLSGLSLLVSDPDAEGAAAA